MSDNTYLLILRLLHIGCGILWAGTAIAMAIFFDPAIKGAGPDGTKVLQQLAKNRFPLYMMILAIITVVAGSLLIWKVSGGLQSAWLASKNGKVLTGGATLAIIAFLVGFTVSRPTGMKLGKIAKSIAMAGGPPTAVQISELQMLSKRLGSATRIIAFLLAFAIVGMSIFRYI